MDDYETDLQALQTAVGNLVDSPMVTRWVVVAETMEDDGSVCLVNITSPGLAPYVASGMMRWEADALAAQPRWTVYASADADDETEDE